MNCMPQSNNEKYIPKPIFVVLSVFLASSLLVEKKLFYNYVLDA